MIRLLAKLFIKNCDNYEDNGVRTKYGVLTGIVGIALNFLLFGGKLIAGIITSSVSISADAFNNLSDAGSAVISIAGYKIAAMPADREHPFGHGRAEYAAGLIVATAIVFMAFEIGKESVQKIITPEEPTFSVISIVILSVSILVKLYIFAYNHRYGRLLDSAPMKAVAVDSLSDCISTGSAIAALVVFMIWNVNIDGYIGLFISLIILRSGVNAARESLRPLLGEKADDKLAADIKEELKKYDNILGIHDLAVHNYGVNKNLITLHAEVPAELSFIEAHDLVDAIEHDLGSKYSAVVTIHMDPVQKDNEETLGYKELIGSILGTINPEAQIHDFRIIEHSGKRKISFDVEVPFGTETPDDEIRQRLADGIAKFDSTAETVVCIDKKIY